MYKCYLTNFGWYLQGEFKTVEDAIAHGKVKGFEFLVFKTGGSAAGDGDIQADDTLIASWSVFGGTSYHQNP
jgi:hypothetical protein